MLDSVGSLFESKMINSWSVRVRGDFTLTKSELFSDLSRLNEQQIIVRTRDTFRDWKTNTLEQVLDFRQSHYILCQEDHILYCDSSKLDDLICQTIDLNLDIINLSAFYTYMEMRKTLSTRFLDFQETNLLVHGMLSKKRLLDLNIALQSPRYPISLLSLVSRKLLIKLLTSDRPYFRRYHFNTPFDFEQSPKQTWYLPVRIGLPNFEVFACIDDDIKIKGTSLQSRGVYPIDHVRGDLHSAGIKTSIEHASRNFLQYYRLGFLNSSTLNTLKHRAKRIIKFLDYAQFTLFAKLKILGFDREWNKRRRLRKASRKGDYLPPRI